MQVAEAPRHSCILEAEEVSMAIMEEEEEEEEQAYEEAICQDELIESMQSLRPLLMSEEVNTPSDSSLILHAYDLDQDISLSCDQLSPPYQHNWSLDPLHNEPPHSNPTWIRAITFEETSKHIPQSSPLVHESRSHEDDLPNPHSIAPFEESPPPSHKGFSPTKQVERADHAYNHGEPDCIELRSNINEANRRSNAFHGEVRKRLLNGERKWPYFLKSCSSKRSMSTTNNGDASTSDRGRNTSRGMDCKKDYQHSYNANDTISNGHTNNSFRFSKGVTKVGFFKVNSSSHSLKHKDTLDNVDNYSEDEGYEKMSSKPSKGSTSKNLLSERKRRQKLNERLYSLRALVPTISKMDKASIVGDAINYVRDLQKQVVNMEEDIANLEVTKQAIANGLIDTTREPKRIRHATNFDGVKTPRQHHKIVELDVMQMEHQLYQFRIHCKKSPGVLLQLTRALESLEFEIVNANLTSINDHILNTLVIEVANAHLTRSEDVRERTLEVIPKFGLFISNT